MPDLEVTVFNQKLKLSYLEDEKERLTNAINILNESWNKFSNLYGKVSDLKIITLISLELQDSIKDYEDKLKLQKAIENTNFDVLKNKEISENFNGSDTGFKNWRSLHSENKNLFFNLGPENKWEKKLSKKIRKDIEISFNEEMKNLGYL